MFKIRTLTVEFAFSNTNKKHLNFCNLSYNFSLLMFNNKGISLMRYLYNAKDWIMRSLSQFIRSSIYLAVLLLALTGLQYLAYNLFSFSNMNQLSAWNLMLMAVGISIVTSYIVSNNNMIAACRYWASNFLRVFPPAIALTIVWNTASNISLYAGLAAYMLGFFWYYNFTRNNQSIIQSLENAGSRIMRNPLESAVLYVLLFAILYVQQVVSSNSLIVSNAGEALNYASYSYINYFAMFITYNANRSKHPTQTSAKRLRSK